MGFLRTFLMFIGLGATSVFATAPAWSATLEDKVQTLLAEFHMNYRFPGATVAYALDDGQVVSVATGLADVEAETVMTPDSRMLAASIGKTFVAATILSLESDGVLARDDLVSQHLKERSWFDQLPNGSAITVNDLLRHCSGLADHVNLPAFAAEMTDRASDGHDAMSPEQAIAFILDEEPLFPAGAGWAYSDTGYLLLGLVIEEATGQSYYDVVTQRLLAPLGLLATSPSNGRTLDGLAVGYTVKANPFGLPPRTTDANGSLTWDPAIEWTGGGLVSTSHDLAVWGHALFTEAALQAPYLSRLLDGVSVSPEAPSIFYGAGVAIYSETQHGPVYGHGGWIPGYVSSLRHYADSGVTIAFQINTDVGIVGDSTNLVPVLEAALADLVINHAAE